MGDSSACEKQVGRLATSLELLWRDPALILFFELGPKPVRLRYEVIRQQDEELNHDFQVDFEKFEVGEGDADLAPLLLKYISPSSARGLRRKSLLQGVPKNALSECCWSHSHSALAQSQVAGIP